MSENPYVGPRPYEREDRFKFYGRDREARELRALIVAEREVLFYAQSGAGKTSLLNAQVIPSLEDKGFDVLPIARVSIDLPPDVEGEAVQNIFVFSALMSLAAKDVDPQSLMSHTLSSFLKHYVDASRSSSKGRARPFVIIFDQFEELFTTHRDRWQDARGFFEQVRDALEALPGLGVVFALREDYIASLDAYAPLFPRRLQARFRMERLRRAAALLAIREPLSDTGRAFDTGVAEQLLEDLLKVRVEVAPGQIESVDGEFVEPVQLQVVCQGLWQDLPPEVTLITYAHLRAFGDVNQALAEFYERSVRRVVRETGVREGKLREWFEQTLMTTAGTRGTVYRDQKRTGGIPNAAVDVLQNLHLIRGEWRAGGRWYELTHDRFIGPIQASNEAWRARRWRKILRLGGAMVAVFTVLIVLILTLAAKWTVFIQQASQGVRATATVEAAQAYQIQTTATADAERASEVQATATAAAETAAELANSITRVRARPLRPGLSMSGVGAGADTLGAFVRDAQGVLYFVGLADSLGVARDELGTPVLQPGQSDGGVAPDDEIGTFVKALPLVDNVTIAHMLGLAQLKEGFTFETLIPGIGPILGVREAEVGMTVHLLGRTSGLATGEVLSVGDTRSVYINQEQRYILENCILTSQMSQPGDGGALVVDDEGYMIGISVAGSQSSSVLAPIQDVLDVLEVQLVLPGQSLVTLTGHRGGVIQATWLPDSVQLVTAGEDGAARVWNAWSGELLATLRGHQGAITTMSLGPEGRWLATGSADATVHLWDLTGPNPSASVSVLREPRQALAVVAFSPDGRWLVAGGEDKVVYIWDMERLLASPRVLRSHPGAITVLAFSSDGRWLATADDKGHVHLSELLVENSLVALVGHAEGVTALAFSGDGTWLATGAQDGSLFLWNMEELDGNPLPLTQQGDVIMDVAFSPDSALLAVGGADTSTKIWTLRDRQVLYNLVHHSDVVRAVAWSPDGKHLVLASSDSTATVWDTATGELRFVLQGHTGGLLQAVWRPDGTRIVTTSADGSTRIWQGK